MSILSLLKKGSLLAEEQASRELCWFCPEGHFPKLNFILKLNVNEFNGSSHCRSLLGGVQCRELISVMRAPLVIKHLMSIFPFFPSLQFFSGNVFFSKAELSQPKNRDGNLELRFGFAKMRQMRVSVPTFHF